MKDTLLKNALVYTTDPDQFAEKVKKNFKKGDLIPRGMYTIRDKLDVTYSDSWEVNKADKEYIGHFMSWDVDPKTNKTYVTEIFDPYIPIERDDKALFKEKFDICKRVLNGRNDEIMPDSEYLKFIKTYIHENDIYPDMDSFHDKIRLFNSYTSDEIKQIQIEDLKRFIIWIGGQVDPDDVSNKNAIKIIKIFDEPLDYHDYSPYYYYETTLEKLKRQDPDYYQSLELSVEEGDFEQYARVYAISALQTYYGLNFASQMTADEAFLFNIVLTRLKKHTYKGGYKYIANKVIYDRIYKEGSKEYKEQLKNWEKFFDYKILPDGSWRIHDIYYIPKGITIKK